MFLLVVVVNELVGYVLVIPTLNKVPPRISKENQCCKDTRLLSNEMSAYDDDNAVYVRLFEIW